MKNTIFIIVLGLSLSMSAQAQKKKAPVAPKPVAVPELIGTAYKNSFTSTQGEQWSKNYRGHYIVSFTNAMNQHQSVEYDDNAVLVKSKISYPADGLPEVVSRSLASQYANAPVNTCERLEIPGVKPYYKVQIGGADQSHKDLLISEEGTVSE
jgi:hypothetical protein